MKSIDIICALAGQAGLTRGEIRDLQWEHVHLQEGKMVLSGRTIPLTPTLTDTLRTLQAQEGWWPPHVLRGQGGAPMALGSISRLARQEGASLDGLRRTYIINRLETAPWQEVQRETGLGEAALRKLGVSMTQAGTIPDEYSLARGLRQLGETLGALAVVLAYDGGFTVSQLRQLTWETAADWVPSVRAERLVSGLKGVGLVFPNASATAPLDAPRLSRLGRDALVSAGLEGVTLQALAQSYNLRLGDGALVLELLAEQGSFVAKDAQEWFQLEKSATYRRLQVLVKGGVLTQVGGRYYDARQVPHPERHGDMVRDQARYQGVLYRGDVVNLLHITPRQATALLARLVQQGTLIQEGQQYFSD